MSAERLLPIVPGCRALALLSKETSEIGVIKNVGVGFRCLFGNYFFEPELGTIWEVDAPVNATGRLGDSIVWHLPESLLLRIDGDIQEKTKTYERVTTKDGEPGLLVTEVN